VCVVPSSEDQRGDAQELVGRLHKGGAGEDSAGVAEENQLSPAPQAWPKLEVWSA